MKLGFAFSSFSWSQDQGLLGDTFRLIVERVERAGFFSLWIPDHFFQIDPTADPQRNEMLEGWSALAFAAGCTNRVKLGTLVTGVTHRHPGVLLKAATTLDVLSHGRTYFGIGAAWSEAEHRGLGIPFPGQKERFERLEETLQIAQHMWSGKTEPFQGKYYHLEHPLNSPQAVQQPHPPILVGGSGEQKTLRLVAQYADACNFLSTFGTREHRLHKLAVLREHCERLKRPYEQIEKTVTTVLHITRMGARER
ncbi:LLM class F420-dependent oxidoreductase [Ktedonosporobacter rubrisoli]|uniref:LLM class F420-dependent oxidoreductase n=1 Tax=Ktedonosporobacter rubrisoli TaxID=2509675 RepID=A0A4P6JP10_KTERU|nr:LLM class F420-dependent oxidoreductase [Ktedonosporobacter rubrisoli]QBD77077.1 LLM class F420-dependent oxidoreductase [Ktedonosporobacter rubrisoli]